MHVRRQRLAAGALVFTAGVLAPFRWSWTGERFVDGPGTGDHQDNLNAIATAGNTLGCTDVTHR